MIIVKGYQVESTDICALESAISALQDLIFVQGRKLYVELFANEIETLFDEIAFNITQRPNVSVYDAARQMLDQRISNATGRSLPLPYNFGVQLTVYTHKNEVYIRLTCNNERLMNAIKKTPTGMKDFSLKDKDAETPEHKKRETVWNEIMEIYSGERKPLFRQIIACEGVKLEWKKISEKLHSRQERIETRVRYQLTNSLLNMLGMGQQIPPHKLLPYIDESLQYLENDSIQSEAKRMMIQASQNVINITEELVMSHPEPMPAQNQSF